MSTAIDRALIRSRSVVSSAHDFALSLKATGTISSFLDVGPSAGLAQLAQFQDQSANTQLYMQFRGWVHAAINALSTEAAKQPVHVGRMVGPKGKGGPSGVKTARMVNGDFVVECIKDHHIRKMTSGARTKAAKNELEVFNEHLLIDVFERPNPIQYGWQFVYSFVSNLCLTGWSFIVGGRDDDGRPELYSLPTTWVYPDHSKGSFAEFRIINPKNPSSAVEQKPLTREQVAFAYLPNPSDPLAGLAPARAQNLAIKIDDHIQSSQATFFKNAIFPSAIVTIGKMPHPDVPGGIRPRLTAAQRRQVYGAIRKVSAGISNYGNPAIIDGLIESIERLSPAQNEIGWEKSEKSVRTRILSAFGVHPFILGEEMAGSYAQAYVVQDRFCSRVNVFLDLLSTVMSDFAPSLLEKNKEKLLVWWEEAKAVDPSMVKSLWEGARGRDDVSQNEFRAFMDLPPDEDRNEAVINKSSVQAIGGLAAQVKGGQLAPEQCVAILEGLGLPTEMAEKIAGEAPPPKEEGGGFEGEVEEEGFEEASENLEEAIKELKNMEYVISKSGGFLDVKCGGPGSGVSGPCSAGIGQNGSLVDGKDTR